jgi:hypothetical protein
MKTYFLALTMGFFIVLFGLGSCIETEYIEVEKIIKERDTVTEYIDRYFTGMDSTKIPVAVIETPVQAKDEKDSIITIIQYDTLYEIRYDSIFTIVTKYDTIVDRIYFYKDTLYQYIFARGAFGLPTELEEQYGEFFAEVDRRGISYSGSGSALLIQYKSMDDALQAYSFDYGGQIGIMLNDKLTPDESMIPMWRELARVFLKKQYSLDDNNPMSQRFPSDRIRWSNRQNFKSDIDKIFN